MITEFFAHLGGRVEDRLLHVLHTTGGSIKEHTEAMLCRASRTVRRGSLIFLLALVGVTLLAVGWVMLNLALHSFLVERLSTAVAHLVIMGINIIAGGIILIVAAKLTLTVDGPMPLPRRRLAPVHRRWPPLHVSPVESARPMLPDHKQASLSLPAGDITSALGATIELGILAAQTIPQIMRAFRRPAKQ